MITKAPKAPKAKEILLILSMAGIIGIIVFIISMQSSAVNATARNSNVNMDPIIMHIHSKLSILVNGTSFNMPAQIGIDPSLWKDHSLDECGMQSMPEMNMSAMAPLHTHDNSGIVHVESTVDRNYTLGEFLNVWGLDLNSKTVRMTTDGKPVADFKEHILRDGEQINLEVRYKVTD